MKKMKKKLIFLSLSASLFLVSCTTTNYSAMQISPVTPVLNINPEQYEIIGIVEGTGIAGTYEAAKDAAIGAAVASNKDADALMLPKFEVKKTEPKIPFFKGYITYEVKCIARAVKLKK